MKTIIKILFILLFGLITQTKAQFNNTSSYSFNNNELSDDNLSSLFKYISILKYSNSNRAKESIAVYNPFINSNQKSKIICRNQFNKTMNDYTIVPIIYTGYKKLISTETKSAFTKNKKKVLANNITSLYKAFKQIKNNKP